MCLDDPEGNRGGNEGWDEHHAWKHIWVSSRVSCCRREEAGSDTCPHGYHAPDVLRPPAKPWPLEWPWAWGWGGVKICCSWFSLPLASPLPLPLAPSLSHSASPLPHLFSLSQPCFIRLITQSLVIKGEMGLHEHLLHIRIWPCGELLR